MSEALNDDCLVQKRYPQLRSHMHNTEIKLTLNLLNVKNSKISPTGLRSTIFKKNFISEYCYSFNFHQELQSRLTRK